MSDTVSNGSNGRNANGQFAKGNRGGPGNPQVRRIAALRTAVVAAVTPDDMLEVMAVLMEKAKKGDMAAIRELFDRTLGRPLEADVESKIAELEATVMELIATRHDWQMVHADWRMEHSEGAGEQDREKPALPE